MNFNTRHTLSGFIVFLFLLAAGGHVVGQEVETGVSKQLAIHRKATLSEIHYALEFDVPAEKTQKIQAVETLSFNLTENKQVLQLDFKDDPAKLRTLIVNGKNVPILHSKEHLLIAAAYLKKGVNQIKIEFQAGESALNRNADYLYTLFVPDRARTVFPCFDQPDLKATYNLTLKVPANWKAMANAPLKDSILLNGRKTYYFVTSDILSTYLFSFVAGKFEQQTGRVGRMQTDFLYRETDTAKIRYSMNEIFKIHTDALKYFEDWTGISYPFQKFGFAAIPDFQFGGMEHVGAIQYKASTLFLDGTATKDQLNSRNNLIAHETAHMWFGDLVTMTWFTDVWMKEVFANFMADKSAEGSVGKDEFDLKFLVDHFPAAYGVDRTTGSNPIRQELDNLKDAGTLYGNIIYHKAPIMMRQLERLMGKDKFKQGVREYLKKFANSNASWPDLITILDKYADADLQQWNKIWVNEPGRPVVDYTIEKKGDKIGRFIIKQSAEYGKDRIWPQLFELTLYYPGYNKEITVNLNASQIELKSVEGMDIPLFVLFNSSGQGYGLWPVDRTIFTQLYTIDKPLNRAAAYISLYENMLNGRSVKPVELLTLFLEGLSKEKEELNLKLITNYIGTIYWEFMSPKERINLGDLLEKRIWSALQEQTASNHKKLLFKTYQDVFLSKDAGKRLYDIWKTKNSPEGLKLSEDDYTALVFSLALRDGSDSSILKDQLSRIGDADRRKRFEFIMPALSSNPTERDQFFKSLEQKVNRQKESNVVAALYYLHHPLRQSTSIKYLPKSLELLEEIQTTGDIFFPQSWLQATFGYYQTAEAAAIVTNFLKSHPNYNPKLKAKILQSADNLFRAQKLLK
ncbi:MAG: M1 family aminopeptidase [Candidatus Pedobacter colombiensis]|uniref:Aminopeptidase N n=1 Tax=Candidatus Pedobacter colombiensis TaxID=3121371 RepID=A0AAJ5W9L5_9SPHI|nr:M1 family aminopeptidase [Pedobacter sp.]WEK20557.1 MAG: M1 family aminopeptidase [Pedobacter sp.]